MRDVLVDTCTFLNMISYNNDYIELGISGLEEILDRDNKKIENYERDFQKIISQTAGFKFDNNLAFETNLENYDDFVSARIGILEGKIKNAEMKLSGYVPDKKKNKLVEHIFSDEQKQMFSSELDSFQAELKQLQEIQETLTSKKETYLKELLYLQAGRILEKSIKGDVNLHISASVLREIYYNNHGEEEIVNLTKNQFTLVSVKNDSVNDKVRDIAKGFKTAKPNSKTIPMPDKKDVNKAGNFGDSWIMAEASLAGMVLITQNAQDYIGTIGKTSGQNEAKRKHIELVAKENIPYATDALPYTSGEFLAGKCKEPLKENHCIHLEQVNVPRKDFKNEVSMEM